MAFTSFLGRVLFASIFILSAYQEFNEFGVDGGPAAKALKPKFGVFTSHVQSHAGIQVPEIEIKHLVSAAIFLKGIGGILFIFGSSLGAYLLIIHQLIAIPILYDFYNYDNEEKEFNQLFLKFTQNMALYGALLFFVGMKNSFPRRLHKKKWSSCCKSTLPVFIMDGRAGDFPSPAVLWCSCIGSMEIL
ncbi:HR-LIKE LESION-INDUCING PROTEIN [Salix koriyanagi]|uniref:HR-LIKE LESION-INDUCING PROTEIN n=1 Tax=Salix koriyanagi TaxID=2511006 RepID=A0A9Q0P438_9ROSI|nr:HR-LIKE LESION-INDUCING PROTEIN [Salix koriyanagi]